MKKSIMILLIMFSPVLLVAEIEGKWNLQSVFHMPIDHREKVIAFNPASLNVISSIEFDGCAASRECTAIVVMVDNLGYHERNYKVLNLGDGYSVFIPEGKGVSFNFYYITMDRDNMWFQYATSIDKGTMNIVSSIDKNLVNSYIGIMNRVD